MKNSLKIPQIQIKGINISKITLGTAQLVSNYGIANLKKKSNSGNSILKYAMENNINTFDTSPTYGKSEKTLGKFFQHTNNKSTIITKIPKIPLNNSPSLEKIYYKMKIHISKSLLDLQLDRIPICLLHNAKDMNNYDGMIRKTLLKLKHEKLINLIGVSAYTPEEVKEFLKYDDFDVIQIPINIFDRRLINTKLLDELHNSKKIIFARSIFLQGLLFLDPHSLPKKLEIAKDPLIELNEFCKERNITIHEIAFKFIQGLNPITSMIVGVEDLLQLKQSVEIFNSEPLSKEINKDLCNRFNDLPEELINPIKWNL